MPWTPLRTWTDGDQVTAAALNTDVRDNMVWLDNRVDQRLFQVFLPQAVQSPFSPKVLPGRRNGHACLFFQDEFTTYAVYSSVLPLAYTGSGLVVELYWTPADAGTGTVAWTAEFESHTEDVDNLASDSFGAATTVTDTVPLQSGIIKRVRFVMADGAAIDSVAAGESYRLRIGRDADHAEDDMAGYAQLFRVVVREG